LKLSRTIADLDNSQEIDVPHVAEAIQYRPRRLSVWPGSRLISPLHEAGKP
ncbi:hypothetical protein ACFLYO_00825, partial [Chloroflexota bacterium]